jgi:hypothetical protein
MLWSARSGKDRIDACVVRLQVRAMRWLLLLVVAAMSSGCGLLPWANDDTGLVCQRGVGPGGANLDNVDPLAADQPMAGLDVTSMSAAEVGSAAVERGLVATWRYTFAIGEAHGPNGYGECWCIAPPAGRVTDVLYDSTGGLIVFVDSGQVLASPRQQPRLGWGCEEEAAATVR